ncbi:MAG: hypothetical protein AAF721_01670 [Myxococcota bacterium]
MLLPFTVAATVLAAPAGTVFVNFDGATLEATDTFDHDDARSDTSWLYGGEFEAYGDGVKRAAVLQALRADWAEFDVVVTDQRPTSGEYVMSVVTPTNPEGGQVVGYAPVDCWDEGNHSNVTFAFHFEADAYTANGQATTISQEVAHSFGLEHVDAPADIMNPFNDGADSAFTDACAPLVGPTVCRDQHAEFCPEGGQNSRAELMAMFGPARMGAEDLVASIVQPADGDAFAPGDDVVVEVALSGAAQPGTMVLLHNGEAVGESDSLTWTIENIDFGLHDLTVVTRSETGAEQATRSVVIGAGIDPLAVMASTERGEETGLSCSVGTPPAGLTLLWLLGLLRRRATAPAPRRRA